MEDGVVFIDCLISFVLNGDNMLGYLLCRMQVKPSSQQLISPSQHLLLIFMNFKSGFYPCVNYETSNMRFDYFIQLVLFFLVGPEVNIHK